MRLIPLYHSIAVRFFPMSKTSIQGQYTNEYEPRYFPQYKISIRPGKICS
ncbi:hypothetical protein [Duncaniella dubosii]